ncbi:MULTISPECIES: NADH-quinone oxidoreductase subunit J [unclassified Brevundimonas]|uniref:NADH-quinone oxidoreductase subunit J n=1 Tax=unclassified Brevundimonas TaxID=2622653 RepID=UPI000CFBC501|nr:MULTISPECIES: NADH-quinone oxidoreductase subunit J [unclassified Brevundimonas]PRA31995.1 NADH:ubiquinone oxidoreductase subunit J [Brevundimonas sp. MYb27]PQZ82735.1 NADH:ubiquinone oxidoreductase subunit J [Brevundimonas sp. MYb31]PRB16979.1 NADH:ubiquinone oxidoreductase subunit J [Brevundimonas sp. MYb52]PRB37306.1 NADH:ubiquinone oxidoreductase subunit J [Brevundimonas sp. MYb46]PRB54810.1 NADH:ubiquinone oxidoreductase subunit J [Brevundimonas sp. MYb33]
MLQGIAFYLLATVAVVSGLLVVTARNPVHSVLWLILSFFSAAGLFVLLGAEFLAMLLVVVYVGAVAVLFLFVVMMLDVDFVRLREGYARYLPLAGIVAGVLLAEMIMVSITVVQGGAAKAAIAPVVAGADASNIETIGRVLYTDYVYFFQAAGIVLLIAMIGAIVLTLRHRPGVRRQDLAAQANRERAKAVEVKSVATGQGVTPEELL